MRIATETVWETPDGKLVPAGHKEAAVLVAAKGHPVSDKKLGKFSKADLGKFFKDATFDRSGKMEPHPMLKQPVAMSFSRLETPTVTKASAQSEADAAAEKQKQFLAKQSELNQSPSPSNRESATRKKLSKRRKK